MNTKFFILLIFIMSASTVHANDAPKPEFREPIKVETTLVKDGQESVASYNPESIPDDDDDSGMISISFVDPYDLNWQTAFQDAGMGLGPNPIVLPLLQAYPIDALEIKFKLLNKKF